MEIFTFRNGTIADKEQLKQLGLLSYGQYASILTKENWGKLNTNLNDDEKLISLIDQSTIFVCCIGEKIIGMAYFVPNGNAWDIFKAEWSYIRMVGVDPSYSGRGIAKKLTHMCIEKAKKTNEKIIALHTSEFMDAARHIYENLGFKKIQEIPERLGKKYWLYTLKL
jgi:ribosomal protein S18 acetylase RimI-like enzyme